MAYNKEKAHEYYLKHRKLKGRRKGKGKKYKAKSSRAQIHKRKLLRDALRSSMKVQRSTFRVSLLDKIKTQRAAYTKEITSITNRKARATQRKQIAVQRKTFMQQIKAQRKVKQAFFKQQYKEQSTKINSIT